MADIQQQTTDCMDAMGNTQNIFETIYTDVLDVTDKIISLEHTAEVLNRNKDDIIDKFSNISSETEEFTAASQEIFGKVEEQNQDIISIGDSTKALMHVVKDLNQIIEIFDV